MYKTTPATAQTGLGRSSFFNFVFGEGEERQLRYNLKLFSFYRLLLAVSLQLSIVLPDLYSILGRLNPDLFNFAINSYFLFALFGLATNHTKVPSAQWQVNNYYLVDSVFIIVVVLSTGALFSGLDILLMVPSLFYALNRQGKNAIYNTAIVAVMLTLMEVYLYFNYALPYAEMIHAGLLSMFVLLSSVLASAFHKRLHQLQLEADKQRSIADSHILLSDIILEDLHTGVIVCDVNGEVKMFNNAAEKLLHFNRLENIEHLSAAAPDVHNYFRYWMKNIKPSSASQIISYQGKKLALRLSLIGTYDNGWVVLNVNDEGLSQEKQQEEKLAALGQMTAKIAHEIRNPLGAISHAAQLMSESDDIVATDERMLQIILSNSDRVNATIESVLSLSRKQRPKMEEVDLNAWLLDFLNEYLLSTALNKAQIKLLTDHLNPVVQFDNTHLHQVVWNICKNAEKYAKNRVEDLQLVLQIHRPQHTRDIVLNIIDNGEGIDDDAKDKLFEPFFTTGGEAGTGLGLYMAREICLSNKAKLEYKDITNAGSCFSITFSQNV